MRIRDRAPRWLALPCLGLALALTLPACSDDDSPGADAMTRDGGVADADVSGPDGGAADASPDAEICPRNPGPANYTRKVVVSHPYDASGDPASSYEVFDLTAAGALSSTGATFEMGRGLWGEMAFTPDGAVGLVAQDDGTLGVFTIDAEGAVTVVHAAFTGGFYAERVVMDPAGDGAWVLDAQWRVHGGGIHRVAIGCDGSLTDQGLVAAAKLPRGFALLPDGSGRAVVAAHDILDSAADQDAHLLSWGATPGVQASTGAFSDDDTTVGSLAVTPDSQYALIGDNQGIFSTPNRVAVVAIGTGALTATQELTPIPDPITLVPSPFGDVVLVVSGIGDALYVLDYDDQNATTPFALTGELTYTGAGPQLPSGAVLISRGTLNGRVIVAELSGIRMVDFEGSGTVTDLGRLDLGSGMDRITGAIGIQP